MANKLNGSQRGVGLPGPQGRFGMGRTAAPSSLNPKADDEPDDKQHDRAAPVK